MLLSKRYSDKIFEYIQHKITIKNTLSLYQLARIYEIPSLAKHIYNDIQRWFTLFAETVSFLEFDYFIVERLLANSHISKIKLIKAVNAWLGYDIEQRRKFAKQLLTKCRLHLLRDHILKEVLNNISSFTCIDECVAIIIEVIKNKKHYPESNMSSVSYKNQLFNRNEFSILFCGGSIIGGGITVKSVYQVDGTNLKNVKAFPPMINERRFAEAVCVEKGDVYVLGGCDRSDNLVDSVEKYSPSTNTWNIVAGMYDDRKHFCVCAFKDRIFVFGRLH